VSIQLYIMSVSWQGILLHRVAMAAAWLVSSLPSPYSPALALDGSPWFRGAAGLSHTASLPSRARPSFGTAEHLQRSTSHTIPLETHSVNYGLS
jgi:hypothetical protein